MSSHPLPQEGPATAQAGAPSTRNGAEYVATSGTLVMDHEITPLPDLSAASGKRDNCEEQCTRRILFQSPSFLSGDRAERPADSERA